MYSSTSTITFLRTSTQKVLVLEYEYKDMSTITPSLNLIAIYKPAKAPQQMGAFAEATANWQETNAIDIGANKQGFVPNLLCLMLIKCNQRNW